MEKKGEGKNSRATTYLQTLGEGERLLLGVVLLRAHPARAREEHDRVEHISAVHLRGVCARLVRVQSEEAPLRMHRPPRELQPPLWEQRGGHTTEA